MSLDILGAITGLFVVVYDGQHALRFTLGRARAVVGPGIHFKWPLLQTFKVEETKHTTLDLEPQVIQLDDDLVYEVDAKVVYKIVNLRKAIIEIDDLVTGLQNRVVIAVQSVVARRTRATVTDVDGMCDEIRKELEPVEDTWGVRILKFGFSNISPSPTTLEITQLELLTQEKRRLYAELRERGLSEEASVALVSGAVVSVHPDEPLPMRKEQRRPEKALVAEAEEKLEENEKEALKRKAKRNELEGLADPKESDPFAEEEQGKKPGAPESDDPLA
ncbi:SPFH domain / Band 7 family protein [Planctomycetes bacterium Poly30]|uniref:SPFH domain / Band 7 family protein n=1 Tax=Saltatorellus ferox TaxID=2528018 RepID=A0A518EQP1_9BACT|nr:SPFH domain / Band 7 family protein [Planctomycetes bacterium Poly30]